MASACPSLPTLSPVKTLYPLLHPGLPLRRRFNPIAAFPKDLKADGIKDKVPNCAVNHDGITFELVGFKLWGGREQSEHVHVHAARGAKKK